MSFEDRIDRFCKRYPSAPKQAITASRLIFRVATRLDHQIDAALSPYGIDRRQYLLLAMLVSARDVSAITPSELGTTLDATRTQITRLLDALETKSLVRRQHSKEDRRSLAIELTHAGAALVSKVAPVVHAAYLQVWHALQDAQLNDMIEQLRRLDQAAPRD
jgi:MarR family transcriptional regulator, negative regulator of the multidrug operon emrRAB